MAADGLLRVLPGLPPAISAGASASGLAALQAMYLAPLELRGEPVHPPSSALQVSPGSQPSIRATDGDLAGTKFFAASAATNATWVTEVLKTALAHPLLQQQRAHRRNVVLEIGSGTGQHTVAVPAALPHVTWIPTDYLADSLPSIAQYIREAPVDVQARVLPPRRLDAAGAPDVWAAAIGGDNVRAVDAIVAVHVLHVAPWQVAVGLFAGAAAVLTRPGGCVVLYGPLARNGVLEPESNVAFDERLRARDPAWGVRDLRDLVTAAEAVGFHLEADVPVANNNTALTFRL